MEVRISGSYPKREAQAEVEAEAEAEAEETPTGLVGPNSSSVSQLCRS